MNQKTPPSSKNCIETEVVFGSEPTKGSDPISGVGHYPLVVTFHKKLNDYHVSKFAKNHHPVQDFIALMRQSSKTVVETEEESVPLQSSDLPIARGRRVRSSPSGELRSIVGLGARL